MAAAMAKYVDIDVLVVGIGSLEPPLILPMLGLSRGLAPGGPGCRRSGGVCGSLIGSDGREIPSRLDKQGLTITSEQLDRIPEIIGVGGGFEKADAIAAVLRGRWVDVLVTDAGVARRLLA